uniref:C2H2-type domain-containing protein n=1 Tax=Amphimedon queenslandica TaxID=400682 RepID=A0A1X7SWS0_AMPQE
MASYSCSMCGSTYSYRSGLSRHKNTCIGTKSSEISDITAAANVGNINCHFTGCDTRFVCSDDLIKHFSLMFVMRK